MKTALLQVLAALALLLVVSSGHSRGETYADWLQTARLGGLALEPGANQGEIDVLVTAYRDQGVSVIELDSGLSNYLDAAGFAAQVAHIDLVAQRAHAVGLKVVIYYPSLEVLTPNGANLPNSMGKDHPEWLQIGLNGTPNVFYGTQEHWVPPNAESAWMSANSPGYKNYFIGRVQQLAGTAVDGIWIDVPLYLDTGVQWSDVRPEAVAAFEAWSVAKGYNYSGAPVGEDMTNQKFRHWLKWRNDNLADFISEVQTAAHTTNPDWAFVTEVYPLDYLDTIWTGLEPAVLKRADNSIVVWELDGVSDSLGMDYANLEDFSSLIAMSKMARAFDRGRPGWGFSYGNLPIDAGLVMAANISAQLSPFESKTPIMTNSVGADFRTKWFDFIRDNEDALLKTDRVADVGVWFSPNTKTFHDFAQGGIYGMYLDMNPPPGAQSWWAVLPELSLRETDHLAGWRGAAYALNEMHVPYKPVVDPGDVVNELQGLSLLWLPSVVSLSDEAAQQVRDFVSNGGTVFATGLVPGAMDEHGVSRAQSNLADVFGFTSVGAGQTARMQNFGDGVAIFRPDIKGVDLFETGGPAGAQALKERNHGQVEQIVRIHTPARLIADEVSEGVHMSLSEASATEQHVFVLNYSGLQKPAVLRPIRVPFHYRPPEGFRVTGALVQRPGAAYPSGNLAVARSGTSTWEVEPLVDQFAIVTFQLAPALPASPPAPPALQFSTAEREDAVTDALAFVVDHMRHTTAAPPHEYGIHTNLLDNNESTTVYTGGHHVTDEHMGLFLRVAALLQNQGRYDEALEFVEEVLFSKGYHVLAWSMHKDKLKPFLQPDLFEEEDVWFAANAPLDDFRAVRGLFDGAVAFGQSDTEALAHRVLNGLYWTSVSDRLRGIPVSRPQYPGGIIGYSWDWADHDDNTLTPPAVGTGRGRLGTDLIPVDYQDLGTLVIGARENPRLRSVIASAVDMMLAAEIPAVPGLFYNGLDAQDQWTGDFEFPGERQGNNLKVIQELWIALHLARVSNADSYVLDEARRQAAGAAALRSYNFFKNFYNNNGQRVPEYLTFAGTDVPDGNTGNNLIAGVENLVNGEARIYSQLARLALLFDDDAFAASVIEDKILTDRITDPNSILYGFIGASTSSVNDAEAFNVLESLLTLCLEAQSDGTPPANSAPVANPDTLQAGLDVPSLIPAVDLLGNDVDPDDDVLTVTSVDPVTSQGGTIVVQGSRWLYTPPPGFLGNDTFGYVMTDGEFDASSTATIEVSEGGGIELELQMDGDLGDWPSGHLVVTDPDDITGAANLVDIREIHMTVRDGKFYLGYVNEGNVVYNWAYTIFIDSDGNTATGYQEGGIGADYILQANNFQQYTGDGSSWSWQTTAVVSPAVQQNVVEMSMPLSVFGGGTFAKFHFIGDNAAYVPNGAGQDRVPEPNANGQWILYDFEENTGSVGGTGPAPGGIDGDLGDWPEGHFVVDDPDDITGAANLLDLRELHMRVDGGDLHIGYVNEGPVTLNWAYILYIDTDMNPTTGYQVGGIGAEYIIEENMVQSYTGTGIDWSWQAVGNATVAVRDNTVEISLPLSLLGNVPAARMLFIGDNLAYEPNGSGEDLVPEPNPQGQWIHYDFAQNVGSVGDPIIIVPGGIDGDLSDWPVGHFAVTDPDDITGSANLIDIREMHFCVHNNDLHIGYVNEGPVSFNWAYILYIDTDLNAATGYQVGAIGADYIIEQSDFLRYTGDGSSWSWETIAPVTSSVLGNVVELGVPVSLFGGATTMRMLFIGDNLAYVPDGSGEDYVPEPNPNGQWMHFDLTQNQGTIGDGTQPPTSIPIDGDLSDWPAHFTLADPDDISGAANLIDLQALHLHSEAGNLYVGCVNEGPVTLNWAYTLYIDSDRNPTTGFPIGGIGADHILEENMLLSYNGAGGNWSWLPVALVSTAVAGDTVEYSVPLSHLGNPSEVSIVFVGDNLAYPPSGSGEDWVPDLSLQDQWISYDFVANQATVESSLSNVPGVDGDLSDWPVGHLVISDPNDLPGGLNKLDLLSLHVRAIDGKLWLGYVNETSVDYNYAYGLYLDTDANPATGFSYSGLGADIYLQDDQILSYTGTGADWSWTSIGSIDFAVSDDTAELAVDLSALGDPTTIRMAFYGDNGAYGGTAIDYVPDAGPNGFVEFSLNGGSQAVTPSADTDLMDNTWELEHGLNPQLNDSLFDIDDDGVINVMEWMLGLDPRAPDLDPLAISLTDVGGIIQPVVHYRYRDGIEYFVTIVLEKTSHPELGDWTPMPTAPPGPEVDSIVDVHSFDDETFRSDTGEGPLAMYYRLRISGTEGGVPFSHTTSMVGYRRTFCPTGSDTPVGASFRPHLLHRADSPRSAVPVSSGVWRIPLLSPASGILAGQVVRFETGALLGQSFTIQAIGATGIDVIGNLSSARGGDRYHVVPSVTIGTIFETPGTLFSSSAGILGTNRGSEVLRFARHGTDRNRSASEVLFRTPGGWRDTATLASDRSNQAIAHEEAFIIRNAGPNASNGWFVSAGSTFGSPVVLKLGGVNSETILAMPGASPSALRDSNLINGGAFEGSLNTDPSSRRDELLVYDTAEVGLNKQPQAVLFYDLSSGQWRSTAEPETDAGDHLLIPGAFLRIRCASGSGSLWTAP